MPCLSVGAPAMAVQEHTDTVSPAEFVDSVAREGLDTSNVIVEGDVDLGDTRRVERLVRCRACTIRGDLRAPDVTFDRVVDLSGVRVHGDLDLHGATFNDVMTLGGGSTRPTRITGTTDLSLATFNGLAALDRVEFGGPVYASSITAASSCSFARAQFDGPVTFQHAHVRGAMIVSDASFARPASFELASFGDATLFRDSSFVDDVSFASASFTSRVDFSSAEFDGLADFDDVVLEGPGIFRSIKASERFSMRQSFAQSLDFRGAAFVSGANFGGVSTDGVLSLEKASVIPGAGLAMGSMSPGALRIDVDLVQQIAGPSVRVDAFRRLEATAEADGNLALANDARYALLSTERESRYGFGRWFDSVVYRGVAGYLVRPRHPLLVLTLLIVVAGVIRAWGRGDRPLHVWSPGRLAEGRRGHRHPSRQALVAAGHAVFIGTHEALRRAVRIRRLRGSDEPESPTVRSVLLGLESVVYLLLIATIVLALSNSSATLREVIDAVRG